MVYMEIYFGRISKSPSLSYGRLLRYTPRRNDVLYCHTYVILLGIQVRSDNERDRAYRVHN